MTKLKMNSKNPSLKRTLLVTLAVTLLALTAAVSKRASSAEGKRAAPTAEASKSSGGKKSAAQGQREVKSSVRVFIHPDDIYPAVVAVPPGKVIISAENNTLKDIALVVERLSNRGQGVARVTAARRDKRNRQEFTLGTGEYIFYEESRPNRYGKLIVDPKFR